MTPCARAVLGLWLLFPASAVAQCGGEERWAVKMGADASAVALLSVSPIATSLHDLVHIPRPALPNDETSRTNAEREVRTVDLTPFIGKSIRLSFESSEDRASSTSFVVDDVRIVSAKHP